MTQNRGDLQSVLDEMFASEKTFSYEVVRRWQERYPEFKREISQAVADWQEFEFLVLKDAETIESSELSETAAKAMQKALSPFSTAPDEVITSLRETAEKQGVARASLPALLGVSETLMRKLERRNLKEIPGAIQEKLAGALRLSVESVQAFFALPSMLPPAARYKAKSAPQTKPKESFADAVRHDPELTEDEKRELLMLQ